jgi:hypothetical protein
LLEGFVQGVQSPLCLKHGRHVMHVHVHAHTVPCYERGRRRGRGCKGITSSMIILMQLLYYAARLTKLWLGQ